MAPEAVDAHYLFGVRGCASYHNSGQSIAAKYIAIRIDPQTMDVCLPLSDAAPSPSKYTPDSKTKCMLSG